MSKQILHAYIYNNNFKQQEPYTIQFIGLPPYKPYEKESFNNLNDAVHSLQDKGFKMVTVRGENEFWFMKEE